jgi:glycosyltransferase involved in cell wall biosynthesis
LVSNTSWSVVNFRMGLMNALRGSDYGVMAAAPRDAYSARLQALGIVYEHVPMQNKGKNPFADLLTLAHLVRVFRRYRPACVLTFTPKPNIYASIAASLVGIPVVANIAGLGSVFASVSRLKTLVEVLYRVALRAPRVVFFQNPDDAAYFVGKRLVDPSRVRVLPGSGVDTQRFFPRETPDRDQAAFTFLLFGRLLADKGVREYVAAARALRGRHPKARFRLLGFVESQNPTAIARGEIDAWISEGCIEFEGATDDVAPHIAIADCVVLPSYYREGTPRSLLEAASMGKPIITTDMPGCRDVVDDRISGLLAQPRSVPDLLAKMESMLELSPNELAAMGAAARAKMLRQFDEAIVVAQYLEAVRRAIASKPPSGPAVRGPI